MAKWVKSINPDGTCSYFRSLEEACGVFGIRHHETLVRLIERGGLADDGRTFFDYPTDEEIKELQREYGSRDLNQQDNDRSESAGTGKAEKTTGKRNQMRCIQKDRDTQLLLPFV